MEPVELRMLEKYIIKIDVSTKLSEAKCSKTAIIFIYLCYRDQMVRLAKEERLVVW
jgi:hypothetical protein